MKHPEIMELFIKNIADKLHESETNNPSCARVVGERLWNELLAGGTIESIEDEFAGTYYRINAPNYPNFRSDRLQGSPIYSKFLSVGDRLFSDAFSAFALTSPDIEAIKLDGGLPGVPASDRIVTLSDNQQSELEFVTTELIAEVEKENGINGDPLLRHRFVGQLKAGRELVRAQTMNAFLFYQTMIQMLSNLIQKYQGHAIGETAKQLWGLLLKHIFTGQ